MCKPPEETHSELDARDPSDPAALENEIPRDYLEFQVRALNQASIVAVTDVQETIT